MMQRIFFVLLLVLALPFVVVAQEATEEPMDDMMMEVVELPEVDPLSLAAEPIIIDGSSTVGPLTIAVGEQFTEEGFPGTVDVTITGSSTGIGRFCDPEGGLDIANASRQIRESEIEDCAAIGREVREFQVGVDALSVIVSQDNTFVDSLTFETLAEIIAGGTDRTWGEFFPDIAGTDADCPIQLFTPGDESGTFLFFVEEVMTPAFGDDEAAAIEAHLGAPGIQTSADDNVIVEGVANDPCALGYLGFAFFSANQDVLRGVAVDAGEGPVPPNAETAESGEYPLARPLFIYSDTTTMMEKPWVAGFINYYLTNVNDILAAAQEDPDAQYRYFPASVGRTNDARCTWYAGTGTEAPEACADMMME